MSNGLPIGAWNPGNLLGLHAQPAAGYSAAGQTLPRSTTTSADKGDYPFHPDSPLFWGVALGVATLFGIFGSSFRVRVGRGRAGAQIGEA